MKKYLVMAFVAVAAVQAGAFLQQINVGKILNYLYNTAAKIPTNMSVEQVANEAGQVVQSQLENIPNQLFGVDLNQIRQTLLKAENDITREQVVKTIQDKIEHNLSFVKRGIAVAQAFIKNPATFQLLLGELSTLNKNFIGAKNTNISNQIQKIINLLQNNQQANAVVTQASKYLSELQSKLATLNTNNISQMSLQDISNQLENLVSKNTVNNFVQAAKNLINQHKSEIKDLVTELKNIDRNQISELISSVQI